MYKLAIETRKGTHVEELYVADPVCVIGKQPENRVVLPGWGVSREHARLQLQAEGVFVENLAARGATRVNGKKVTRYGPLRDDDVIEIHDYRLRIAMRSRLTGAPRDGARITSHAVDATAAAAPRTVPEPRLPAPSRTEAHGLEQAAELSAHAQAMHQWRVRLRKALHEQMDLRRIDVSAMSDEELRRFTSGLVGELLPALKNLPADLDAEELKSQVVAEAVGLGPLEPLLERDDVSEIMVNAPREVFYECSGRLYKSDVTFTDDQAVLAIIQRIVAPVGRRIDESSPMVDARLKDGSRVNAVIPPLALKGPSVTIRKFMKERLTSEHLLRFGSLSPAMVSFLEVAVRTRRNVVISGGTGSGKTTLLNVLSNYIPTDERIVTIEDSAELKLYQPNLVSLEGRPPNQEGSGAVHIRDLVRNALRMRPDRIVVGECRGGEALDMLQAMNTGHDGSLTTVHANTARDCLSRIEVMVMMAGMDLPAQAIREQLASAVNLIVQQSRFPCGTRKITSVSEVVGMEQGRIQLAEVFRFDQTGYDEQGRVQGRFVATGLIPEFYERLHAQGVGLDLSIFRGAAA